MSLYSLRSLTVLGLLTVGAFASAQTTSYTSQSAFLSNVQSGYYLETFDSLAQFVGVATPLSFSSGGFSYTADAVGDEFFNAGPTGDTWLSTNTANTDILFTFTSNNVTAVGGNFFTSDIAGDETFNSITATLNDGSTLVIDPSAANAFGGFTTSVPITTLTITPTNSGDGDWSTVNNLIVGTAVVPAPSSALVLLGGFGMMGIRTLVMRRKR